MPEETPREHETEQPTHASPEEEAAPPPQVPRAPVEYGEPPAPRRSEPGSGSPALRDYSPPEWRPNVQRNAEAPSGDSTETLPELAGTDKDQYFYPNKWARIILTSAEEVMGRSGVNAMLNMGNLEQYIDNYPPDNMKKQFPFRGVGQLQQAIWDMYGQRGARVFAVRAGEQAFVEGLAQFKSVASAAQVAMRVGSLEGKVKLGLEFFSKFFNTVSDQVVEVDEDEKYWIWRITRCPVCWERKSDTPICHLAIGVLQAALAWTTEDRKFRLLETECIAKGDEACVIKIEKIPVE